MIKPKWKSAWEWGDKAKLAELAGISASYLADILRGRTNCPVNLAHRLEIMARNLGYKMPRSQWVFKDLRAVNPLFTRKD